jgi:REP-associated tyrosine transposase
VLRCQIIVAHLSLAEAGSLLSICSIRRNGLLTERIDALREAAHWTQVRYPFQIDAMVILPDHIHAVWTLPSEDADFSTRWRLIQVTLRKVDP